MSEAFTCKSYQIGEAPARIRLLGDKTKKPEAAQHIIEFPGGAIELSRVANDTYWAHIIINRGYTVDGTRGLKSALGQVVDSRLDRADRLGITAMDDAPELRQIAVLIKSSSEAA